MANHGNTPDWDDEEFSSSGNDEPIFIDDDDYPDDSYNLSDIKKHIFQEKVIHSFVEEAYAFTGREAIAEILSSLERKMGWKLEIIATRGSIDNALLAETNTFDEDAWIRFLMSKDYEIMTYRIAYESELAVDNFMESSYRPTSLKTKMHRYIKAKAWNLFQNI